jgi:hypothetical protein
MMFFVGNIDSPPTMTVWSWAASITTDESTGVKRKKYLSFIEGLLLRVLAAVSSTLGRRCLDWPAPEDW